MVYVCQIHNLLPSKCISNLMICAVCSGLDNSGKTTIVLKMNGEDTSVISPTLGFNIKTIIYQKSTPFSQLLVVFMFLVEE